MGGRSARFAPGVTPHPDPSLVKARLRAIGDGVSGLARSLLTMCAVAVSLVTPSLAHAKGDLYGFVIGINDYLGNANDLAGSVNDAEDLAGALRAAKAKKVIKFIDQAGTKFNIERSFLKLVADAREGDTILFSYSGHGAQEPEPQGRNGEPDGKNENFLLSGYTTKGPGTKERIVDDEIYAWLQKADAKGVNVVFIADSCHSGTMNRSVRNDVVRYRTADFGAITDDELAFPPPETAKIEDGALKHVTFISATTDDKLTPEVKIEGKWRGALSWSMARAIEGRADRDGNGQVDQFELVGYIVPTVASWVESQQTPQVVPLRPERVALFPVDPNAASTLVVASAETGATGVIREAETDPLTVAVEGGDAAAIDGVPFTEVAGDAASADIIWNRETGSVAHRIGGEVASGVDEAAIKPILAKFAVLKWLEGQRGARPDQCGARVRRQALSAGRHGRDRSDGGRAALSHDVQHAARWARRILLSLAEQPGRGREGLAQQHAQGAHSRSIIRPMAPSISSRSSPIGRCPSCTRCCRP